MLLAPLPLLVSLMICAAPQTVAERIESQAAKAMGAIPGKSAFAFTEITPDGVQALYGLRANESFAVGSSFKLFILGQLIEEVNQDRRQLSDTMRLERAWHGPPSSEMATWPVGMPVTLHTLALKMIWISDNTATDHLHHLLGREAIERQMIVMGHAHPEVNRPLLSTREMTMLRDKKRYMPGKAYLKLDDNGRREFLTRLATEAADYEQLDFDTAAYSIAEWYATPLDMARALAWIEHHSTADQPAHLLRDALAVDTKLTFDPRIWKYAGFKGGSEDQLLAGNWLLQHANGRWYTYHVYFNNPEGPVKPEQVMPVMETIFKSIEATLK
jgi:beta-lactamase class A